jgi:hypothetical protein
LLTVKNFVPDRNVGLPPRDVWREGRLSRYTGYFVRAAWLTLMAIVLSVQPTLGQAPARTVKNAVLQLVTGNDGKDDTDVLTVTVADADGKFLERVFDAKEEIKPDTTFNLWLSKLRAQPAEKVKGSKVTFRIDPKWDEHWVVKDARLTVNYESGAPDRWHWGPFVLERKGAGPYSVEFTLSDDRRG